MHPQELGTLGYVAPVAAAAAPVQVGALPAESVKEVPEAAAAPVEVPALPLAEVKEIPVLAQEPGVQFNRKTLLAGFPVVTFLTGQPVPKL